MDKQRESRPALHSALAGVEACDTQYKAGVAEIIRRRTLVLRIRPAGLWIVVALALAPSLWPLSAAFARIAEVEPTVNAMPTLCEERARAAAKEVTANARQNGSEPGWLGGLPIGLAHGIALARDVPEGACLTWDDVTVDPSNATYRFRREMERAFRGV